MTAPLLERLHRGDPVAQQLLHLARILPEREWGVFVRCGERIVAGVPAPEAEVLMHQELAG